jgi:hypothetical protein
MRPSFGMLVDWIDGRQDPATAKAVEFAIQAGDQGTRETVRWLRRFRQIARELPLEEPPPRVARRLHRYFELRHGTGSAPVVESRAELVFDSRTDQELVGMRAGQAADEIVHVAYQSIHADLVVDISRVGGQFRLDGQLLPIDPSSALVVEVTARAEGVDLGSVDGDALGRFCLQAVPAGPVELRASTGEFVVVADLQISAPGAADERSGQA